MLGKERVDDGRALGFVDAVPVAEGDIDDGFAPTLEAIFAYKSPVDD